MNHVPTNYTNNNIVIVCLCHIKRWVVGVDIEVPTNQCEKLLYSKFKLFSGFDSLLTLNSIGNNILKIKKTWFGCENR